jgi:predicted enzyme related to lactoylglutathione lyase
MNHAGADAVGFFCWVDLAASDADRAKAFYADLFGWKSHEQPANGGRFTRLRLAGRDVGSLYQLKRAHLDNGVPSHWTPYIRVADAEQAVERAVSLGSEVIIRPFHVAGIARIALILDSVGAPVGLWEPTDRRTMENAHG